MDNKELGERIRAGKIKEPYLRQVYRVEGWVKVATVVRWLNQGHSIEETARRLGLAEEKVRECRDCYPGKPAQAKAGKTGEIPNGVVTNSKTPASLASIKPPSPVKSNPAPQKEYTFEDYFRELDALPGLPLKERQERLKALKQKLEKLKQQARKAPAFNPKPKPPVQPAAYRPKPLEPYHSLPLPPAQSRQAAHGPSRAICDSCRQEKVWVIDSDGTAMRSCGCRPAVRSEADNYNWPTYDSNLPFLARENGRFGSMSSSDDYSEESGPEVSEF